MLYFLAQMANTQDLFGSFLPLILFFLGMWCLVFGPQRKRQKEHEKMLKALKTGDFVVTSGGIYGTITNVKEDRLILKIADNTKIELGKNFISQKVES